MHASPGMGRWGTTHRTLCTRGARGSRRVRDAVASQLPQQLAAMRLAAGTAPKARAPAHAARPYIPGTAPVALEACLQPA